MLAENERQVFGTALAVAQRFLAMQPERAGQHREQHNEDADEQRLHRDMQPVRRPWRFGEGSRVVQHVSPAMPTALIPAPDAQQAATRHVGYRAVNLRRN